MRIRRFHLDLFENNRALTASYDDFINAGSEAGVQVGDEFVVYRAGEELIDPDTGISLGTVDSKIGVIKVTNNMVGNGKAAECQAVSGSGFQRNDLVRLQ